MKDLLGVRATGRDVTEGPKGYQLREEASPYYELGGVAVGHWVRYFHCNPERLVVVHDDLDLAWADYLFLNLNSPPLCLWTAQARLRFYRPRRVAALIKRPRAAALQRLP